MLRRFFILCGLFSFALASASDYQKISSQLGLLKHDPIKMLANIENRINNEHICLSQSEREQLIQDLTELKSTLCSRPGAGFLMIPILVTIYFGFKSYWHYQELCMWHEKYMGYKYEAPSLLESLVISLSGAREKAAYECGQNIGCCLISLTVSLVTNLEYRENVYGLFTKERAIERKIDSLIAVLKQ